MRGELIEQRLVAAAVLAGRTVEHTRGRVRFGLVASSIAPGDDGVAVALGEILRPIHVEVRDLVVV